jgi:hypothetical protein
MPALGGTPQGNPTLTLEKLRATIKKMLSLRFAGNRRSATVNPAASGSSLEMKVLGMAWKRIFARRSFWLFCAVLAGAGCQDQEQIRSYDVPKETAAASKKHNGLALAQARPFRFTKPDDWEERPPDMPQGVPRLAVFVVRDGEHVAEVSVVPLPAQGAGALANVNRWRRQLGLRPIDDVQLQKELRHLDVADGQAPYVDLTGRDPTGPQRILGAWIIHGGQAWFIKMKGTPELVGKQQAAFEAFVKSMRFTDGQGAAHE